MIFNLMVGCGIFLITNLSLLYASHLVVRRFMRQCPAPARLAGTATIPYACIILLFQALSPFHAISRLWVTVACLVVAGLCHILWGRHRDFSADLEPLSIWLRDGIRSRWAVLMVMCGFVMLLSLSRALLMPPLAWDCLTYHLTSAALWIKSGTLLIFDAPDQLQYTRFPINGELFAAWLMLPFHSDLLVNLMNFPLMLQGGIACYALARELGMRRGLAGFSTVFICFSPMIFELITTQYVDVGVFAFSCTAVLFALRYLKEGCASDGMLALIAAGIVLGIKFTGIPVVGLIVGAVAVKTVCLGRYRGIPRKLGIVLSGLLILVALGGRQYILNAVEARNPFYPLPVKIMDYKIFEGWSGIDEMNEWITAYEISSGKNKLSVWDRVYRKFCYFPATAGPKFLLFLTLALIAFFLRPLPISMGYWCFLYVMWIVPILVFFADSSMDFARKGYYIDGSTRFLSPFAAIFTIQGLSVISRLKNHSTAVDFFLVGMLGLDLFHANKIHLHEVEVLYPLIITLIAFGVLFYSLQRKRLGMRCLQEYNVPSSVMVSTHDYRRVKTWSAYVAGLCMFVILLYALQQFRDATRYKYFREHSDFGRLPQTTVNGWEFLDEPAQKKTIAMSMNWEVPGHNWFFYPLMGRHLQNQVVYVSAKHKWEVPPWLHRGMLRGDDREIWFSNLKRKEVDYVLVRTPWAPELKWMQSYQDRFQLVFDDTECKIFKYLGELGGDVAQKPDR